MPTSGIRPSSTEARSFVLVHGGRHGAWCWQFVIDQLAARGHEAIALDLDLADESAGASRFAEAIGEVAATTRAQPTLVGHSMSGLVIPLVPELLPIARLIFVCSPLPVPSKTLWEQTSTPPDDDMFRSDSLAKVSVSLGGVPDQNDAIAVYYHDLPAALARWAAGQLRPQRSQVTNEPSPLQAWPSVPVGYVLGRLDRIVNPAWSRREVPRRLGVAPIELDTGHSPFLAQPRALVDALLCE